MWVTALTSKRSSFRSRYAWQCASYTRAFPSWDSVRSQYFTDSWKDVVFFFFQAEDGIRDLTVTGVQTCALPIYVDVVEPDDGQLPGHVDPGAGRGLEHAQGLGVRGGKDRGRRYRKREQLEGRSEEPSCRERV